MRREILINARWDSDAGVWLATSDDVPGLVVEAGSWPAMIDEVRLVLPDLIDLTSSSASQYSVTFKAEEHLDLARA